MRRITTVLLLLLSLLTTYAQKEITATRITEPIKIDGKLDEAIWQTAEVATGFTVWQPEAGTKPSQDSEFRILYDDDAIYFGAYMPAASRDDIKTELSQRDDLGNTDWIGVVLDTYGNGTEASEFILGATGVQFDAKVGDNGEDPDWNEVWFSAVQLEDHGWYAEIKIPYFAIRFPNKDEQSWRINLMRRQAATGEKSSFEFIDPTVPGFINQTAYLKGVKDIKSPLRLSLSPYITTYYQHDKQSKAEGGQSSDGYSYNGGLDLKYGINEAFTLDMTLIPDFGQVRSDDQILNLTPFEVRFAENRSFFTEGTELFGKADLFYSRRVGGRPVGYYSAIHNVAEGETLEKNPSETQLYNATKVSGRTNSGLGLAVFNAIAGPSSALITNDSTDAVREVSTAPLTNYNIIVLDQNLPNNSSISLINTNVWRKGSEFHNANVTATQFDLRTADQEWGVEGVLAYSQLLFQDQDNINGVRYELEAGNIGGNHRYGIGVEGISRDYNHNDLGYFTRNNYREYSAFTSYSVVDGWKSFARMNFWINTFLQTTCEDNKFSFIHFNSGFWAQSKGLWEFNMWTNYEPESNDYFEPRQEGLVLRRPAFYNMGWWIGSDQRKKFALGLNPFYMKYFDEGADRYSLSVSPRYRFSNKFSMYWDATYNGSRNFLGYVDNDDSGSPIIGKRDLVNINNQIGMTYTFNDKMSANIRVRHDWSKVQYEGEFFGLDDDGRLTDTEYNEPNDFSIQYFNIDLNYTWRFATGSDLIFAWRNAISGIDGDSSQDFRELTYGDGVRQLQDLPQRNSISLRLVYFFNAQGVF